MTLLTKGLFLIFTIFLKYFVFNVSNLSIKHALIYIVIKQNLLKTILYKNVKVAKISHNKFELPVSFCKIEL